MPDLLKQEYIRAEAVDYLKHWLGLPYSWGGNDPAQGFDCSGLAIEILQAHGLMRRGDDDKAEGLRHKYSQYTVEKPHAGCLVFFIHPTRQIATHVAMAIDNDFIIHASGGGAPKFDIGKEILKDHILKKYFHDWDSPDQVNKSFNNHLFYKAIREFLFKMQAKQQNAYIKKDSLKAEIKRRSQYGVVYVDPFRSIGE